MKFLVFSIKPKKPCFTAQVFSPGTFGPGKILQGCEVSRQCLFSKQ